MSRLTKKRIDALKSREQEYTVWDGELPGFGARVRPSGRITYVLKYRVGGGRTGTARKPAIGAHGAITAHEARKIAKDWLAQVARGGDPGGARKEGRSAKSVAEVADKYLFEHMEEHNKPSTAKEVRRLVEKRIKPALGTKRITDLSRGDVARFHHGMRASPRQANHALAVLSKMLSLCETWGLRPDRSNPCRHIKRFPEVERSRFLSPDELARLGAALTEAETTGQEPPGAITAIKLLAVTGCRSGEIVGLRWNHVDLDRAVINLPDAKAGARLVVLGAHALALLAGLKRESERVIEVEAGRPLTYSALARTWQRIRKKAGLDDIRLHDLRHGYGTAAGGLGLNAFLVRDLLGHKTLAMSGRYVERGTDPLRAAADSVAGKISRAMEGKEAEVVELSKAKQ